MSENLSTEKRQAVNALWPFVVDQAPKWACGENVFSEEECQKIINLGNDLFLQQAVAVNMNEIRDSQISWIAPSNETAWIYEKITNIVLTLNNQFFNFDLFGAAEGLQFTKYSAPSGKYGKHIDIGRGILVRKLSFTLQLSKPEDYEGGELCLYSSQNPDVTGKSQGSVVVFPSYFLHEVMPVTKGTRYSLVTWITGKPFV